MSRREEAVQCFVFAAVCLVIAAWSGHGFWLLLGGAWLGMGTAIATGRRP